MILQEDGFYLLQEDLGQIVLDEFVYGGRPITDNRAFVSSPRNFVIGERTPYERTLI